MKGKTHSTEEIIRILRPADGGETALSVCREHHISEADLLSVEKENGELKKMLAESMLENRVFKEVNSKKW